MGHGPLEIGHYSPIFRFFFASVGRTGTPSEQHSCVALRIVSEDNCGDFQATLVAREHLKICILLNSRVNCAEKLQVLLT